MLLFVQGKKNQLRMWGEGEPLYMYHFSCLPTVFWIIKIFLDNEGSVFFHSHCVLNERFYYCWQLHILSWCARWRACDNFRLKVVSKNLVSILHQILTYFRQFATIWYCHLLVSFFLIEWRKEWSCVSQAWAKFTFPNEKENVHQYSFKIIGSNVSIESEILWKSKEGIVSSRSEERR